MKRTIALAFFALLLGCSAANATPDLCSLEGGRFCTHLGYQPTGTATIPFVCCHVVDGHNVCVSVEAAGDCIDGILGQCEWGQTNPDGSVTCYD